MHVKKWESKPNGLMQNKHTNLWDSLSITGNAGWGDCGNSGILNSMCLEFWDWTFTLWLGDWTFMVWWRPGFMLVCVSGATCRFKSPWCTRKGNAWVGTRKSGSLHGSILVSICPLVGNITIPLPVSNIGPGATWNTVGRACFPASMLRLQALSLMTGFL